MWWATCEDEGTSSVLFTSFNRILFVCFFSSWKYFLLRGMVTDGSIIASRLVEHQCLCSVSFAAFESSSPLALGPFPVTAASEAKGTVTVNNIQYFMRAVPPVVIWPIAAQCCGSLKYRYQVVRSGASFPGPSGWAGLCGDESNGTDAVNVSGTATHLLGEGGGFYSYVIL